MDVQKQKILHLGKYYSPFHGGIENMMRALMLAQRSIGYDVSAIVHQHQLGRGFKKETLDGITVHRLPIQFIALFVPVSLLAFFSLRKIIKQEKPDLLHLHMPNATCFWLLFSRSARKLPWVIHWHSDVVGAVPDWRIKLLYPIYHIFERRLLSRTAAIITTSQQYLDSSTPLQDFTEKCRVVPLGLPDVQIESEKSSGQGLSLFCVGRLTYYKGHSYLIDALTKVSGEIHLTIVGGGDLQGTLESQASNLELNDKVSFIYNASNEEVLKLMASCDALVLPSIERTEAFGLVLLEAMRAGKPCICTDVEGSGMSEVVQHEKTGLVVASSNADELASAIERLANDPALCEKLGIAGRERFIERFEIRAVASEVDNIYQSVLQQSE
ncbi:glycosyltransferase [Aestuariibacter salexigens]|uniref:glycosyltransferase n=1 Tax=Aestuariibacter salexigens TaxID=226010 RepID=UPI0003F522BE|nr:glycosyltransferase [Aestuariibacter salexigens]